MYPGRDLLVHLGSIIAVASWPFPFCKLCPSVPHDDNTEKAYRALDLLENKLKILPGAVSSRAQCM